MPKSARAEGVERYGERAALGLRPDARDGDRAALVQHTATLRKAFDLLGLDQRWLS